MRVSGIDTTEDASSETAGIAVTFTGGTEETTTVPTMDTPAKDDAISAARSARLESVSSTGVGVVSTQCAVVGVTKNAAANSNAATAHKRGV